ncbi:MAG: exosortase system-associated protein, TIGR04073 family [Candidatus Omnitrophota bacterium]
MAKKFVVLVCSALMLITASTAYCVNHSPVTKFGRGVVNGATCWIEVPKQIYLTSLEYDPLVGITFGAVKGSCYAVLRAASAGYDTAFFLLPPYDKAVLMPEFVFEGWEVEQQY